MSKVTNKKTHPSDLIPPKEKRTKEDFVIYVTEVVKYVRHFFCLNEYTIEVSNAPDKELSPRCRFEIQTCYPYKKASIEYPQNTVDIFLESSVSDIERILKRSILHEISHVLLLPLYGEAIERSVEPVLQRMWEGVTDHLTTVFDRILRKDRTAATELIENLINREY